MRKNRWLLGLLVFIFASCENPTDSGTKDTWSEIDSMHQLEGTWKGTQTRTVPLIDILEDAGVFENPEMIAGLLGIEDPEMITPEMIAGIKDMVKGIKVKITVAATMIFDAYDDFEGTMSGTSNTTMAFSGGNTYILWEMMKGMFFPEGVSPEDLPPGVHIIDKNHSITMDSDMPQNSMTLEEAAASFQINQTGTKLRMEINASEIDELDELGMLKSLMPSEVILYKVK